MPKIETLNGFKTINVTAPVGKRGVNLRDDVIVVQGLFRYALEGSARFPEVASIKPNGVMDERMMRLIRKYQELARRDYGSLGNVTADGRISPAKSGGVPGKNTRWTIVLLNEEADMRYHQQIGRAPGGFINDICERIPEVADVLANSLGTLGLSLESSAPRVGTLRLRLS